MMLAALDSKGKDYRKWNQSKQLYVYPMIQNFNIHIRFAAICSKQGERKNSIIFPEFKFDNYWEDIARKIRRFDDKARLPNVLQFYSYAKAM